MEMRCITCGRLLAASQLQGLCPRCLIGQLGLQLEIEEAAADPVAEASDSEPRSDVNPSAQLKVPGYQVMGELGRGGMGIVYRARQHWPEREIALKMLLPGFTASAELRLRFRQEAATLSRLDHPAILPIYATGEHDGFPWFTMKLATGGSLAERMKEFHGDWPRLAQLVASLADGLQFAHDHGVLHRDLKPANILFDEQDRPYIADFGLAKLADSEPGLTRSAGLLGTPQYLAPEIVAQDARAATTASDLYGLGAILHELLTGRPPFEGSSQGALLQIILEKSPLLERQPAGLVPRDLRVICLKCLARTPIERYATARELAEELRRFIQGEPIVARAAGAMERTWRWCRRRPGMAALTALSGCLLLTVVAVTVFARVRLQEEERVVRHKDYLADMRLADHAIQEQNLGQALELLAKWRPDRPEQHRLNVWDQNEDLRGFEWYLFRELCRGDELFTLGRHLDRAYRVAYSPRGDKLASTAADGSVRLWDVAGRRLIAEGKHDQRVLAVAFSPTGDRLATGGDDQLVRIWDSHSLQSLGEPLRHTSDLVTLAYSADGLSLAALARQEFVLWDTRDRTAKQRQAISPQTWFYGAFAPGLDAIALPKLAQNDLTVWNVPPTSARNVPGDMTIAVGYSPDARFLAAGGFGGQLRVWQTADFRQLLTLPAHEGTVVSLAWTPDGKGIASGGSDGAVRMWDVPTGKLAGTYWGHQGFVTGIAFSPDGRQFATCSADATVRVWDASQAPPPRENPAYRPWPWVVERGGVWAVEGRLGDTAWIDSRRMQATPLPVPAELATTDSQVRLVQNGFLVFAPTPEVRRFDLSGRALGNAIRLPQWPLEDLLTSPDGSWLAWRTTTNKAEPIRLWQVGSTNAPLPIDPKEKIWTFPAFSRDGRFLVAITLGGEVGLWNLPQRRLERRFQAVPGLSQSLGFSRDGRQLVVASVDGKIRIWNTAAWDQPPVSLSAGTRTVWSVGFSPDGRRLAGGGDDGHVFLWDLTTRQMVTRLNTSGKGLISLVGFSSDGEQLMALEDYRGDAKVHAESRWVAWRAPR